MKNVIASTAFGLLLTTASYAQELTANIYTTDNKQEAIGTVVFRDTPYGLLILPHLTHLSPGAHGFHLHQYPSCSEEGMGAGGHFDPNKSDSHQGPYGQGHLGDLPILYVDNTGQATTPTLAPRLKTSDITNLSLMVHQGGDNYTDTPKLGGGGARIACGVVEKK